MAGESRWIFTRAQLIDTPSRKCGIDSDKELNYRQQTANFIQDMGQRLQVTQLCINTAIVYMHRFYMFHSFTKFNRNNMAAACLFLAAKVEEQPRKLEHVIKVAHMCLHRESLDPKSETYLEQAQELVVNENILLQTLGFDIQVDHPHTHVVKTCSLVRASKDLAQTSYFLATNSLHLTTMCLQHKPTVVACVCIHLACKWSNWEIPQSNEGREWFWYTDKDVTLELLEALTQDFLTILDRCPSKLKKKILTWKVCIEKKKPELSGRDGAEGAEPTPLSTSSSSSRSKPSSSAGGPAATSSSAAGPPPSTQSTSRSSQARREAQAAAPPAAPAPSGGDAQPPSGSRGPGDAGSGTMRRVKTEPVLTHQSLTPKEYLQRRERKERELRQQAQQQQQQQQQSTKSAPGQSEPDPSTNLSQESKDRHHMDIFLAGTEQGNSRPGTDGPDGTGRSSRDRPPGEQPHRSSQPTGTSGSGTDARADRRSHDAHRHHQGAPQHSSSSRGPHSGNNHHHAERHRHAGPERGSGSHERANNGHSEKPEIDGAQVKTEPKEGGQHRNEVRDGAHIKPEHRDTIQMKTEPREKHGVPSSHRDGPTPVPSSAHPGEHPPHSSSSSHQKDLKIKINRKAHSVSPSTEMNNEKSLKMKIKLPVSPSMSKRGEERSHRASPLATAGDGLKLKLDLKHRMHTSASSSSNPTDDRHSHSNRPGPATQSGGEGGDHRAEYQLTNQGSNSLKLVISKGKLSGGPTDSPGGGSEKSSKRHHSHHSRSGSEKHHHSRKRGPPPDNPHDGTGRTVSTSRGHHSTSHGHPSKMHRSDSSGHLHGMRGPDGMIPPTNGTHQPGGLGPAGGVAGAPVDQQAQLEQIKQTQLQLQQLIDLHQQQLMQSQSQSHSTNYGQPPLPPQPPEDGTIPPPPPPPPTEPPPLPPYSFN